LKELGGKLVVSRAARDVHAKFLLRNGADQVVYPEKQLAEWTAIRYSSDYIFDYIQLSEEYSIFEIAIPDKWVGKTIGQLDVRKKYNINILAIKDGTTMNPVILPNTILSAGERVLVLGHQKDIKKCFKL
jgi:trk system potassium uptake protein TrkA